jgi:Protein of unknown function (DUF1631)
MATHHPQRALARQAREVFVDNASQVLTALAEFLRAELQASLDRSESVRDMQERRDAWLEFQTNGSKWVKNTVRLWQRAMLGSNATVRVNVQAADFELQSNDIVENKIIASRLALKVLDKASWELNDLMLRVRNLEADLEPDSQDVLRPEALAQVMVEQWMAAPLARDGWMLVQDAAGRYFSEHMVEAFHAANEFLLQQGVMVDVDLRPLVRRAAEGVGNVRKAANSPASSGASGTQGGGSGGHRAGGTAGNGNGGSGSGRLRFRFRFRFRFRWSWIR